MMFFSKKQKQTCLICGYYYYEDGSEYSKIKHICQNCDDKVFNSKEKFKTEIEFQKNNKRNDENQIKYLKAKYGRVYSNFRTYPSKITGIDFLGISLLADYKCFYEFNCISKSNAFVETAIEMIEDTLLRESTQKHKKFPENGFSNCIICNEATIGRAFCPICENNYSKIELLDTLNKKIAPQSLAELPEPEYIPYSHGIEEQEQTCFLCGSTTTETFCNKCFNKYADETIAVIIDRLDKVKRVQIVDKYYSFAIDRCEDGHMVRSKSEKIIDDFLYRHHIWHVYEKPVTVGNVTIRPDFYLPQYDLYIEHLGYKGYKKYDDQTEFKKALYDKKVIYTTEEDIPQIEEALSRKLQAVIKPRFTDLPLKGFSSCLVCGSKTSGHAFCPVCYKKHSKEEMLNILNEKHQR